MQSRSIIFIQPNILNKIYFPFQSRETLQTWIYWYENLFSEVVHVHPLQTREEDALELFPYILTFCLKVINVWGKKLVAWVNLLFYLQKLRFHNSMRWSSVSKCNLLLAPFKTRPLFIYITQSVDKVVESFKKIVA